MPPSEGDVSTKTGYYGEGQESVQPHEVSFISHIYFMFLFYYFYKSCPQYVPLFLSCMHNNDSVVSFLTVSVSPETLQSPDNSIIWDMKKSDYKNKAKKDCLWQEISLQLM